MIKLFTAVHQAWCRILRNHKRSFICTDATGRKVWFCLDCAHVRLVPVVFLHFTGVFAVINRRADAAASLRERLVALPHPLPPSTSTSAQSN